MKNIDYIKEKCYNLSNINQKINEWRNNNQKIIFTNGCFDILHQGHIELLSNCADLGDKLIIGLNSDESIKKIKGENRPINNEKSRKILLGALKFVDAIIVFSEETPKNLIQIIKPDILVKGGDYKISNIVGHDIVKENGGKVVIFPLVKNYSSTNIIDKIRNY